MTAAISGSDTLPFKIQKNALATSCANDFLRIRNIDATKVTATGGTVIPKDTESSSSPNKVKICGGSVAQVVTYPMEAGKSSIFMDFSANADDNRGQFSATFKVDA